eukprot:m.191730 g.191730  ORF g.191730 m.191730 type:complete len:66 (+) comp16959_c0_seq1:115-312(+)
MRILLLKMMTTFETCYLSCIECEHVNHFIITCQICHPNLAGEAIAEWQSTSDLWFRMTIIARQPL